MAGRIYDWIQKTLIFSAAVLVVTIGGAWLLLDISPHIVVSGSMEPEIPVGSLCFVDEQNRYISQGDIIAFRQGSMEITHRVVNVENGQYITKGDHNEKKDPVPVKQSEIIGKTILWIPGLGYGAAFIKSPGGIIASVGFLIIFILAGNLIPDKKGKAGAAGEKTW